MPARHFVRMAHEVHLIQAHTQREEVTGQISLLDFLSIVNCHFNHSVHSFHKRKMSIPPKIAHLDRLN